MLQISQGHPFDFILDDGSHEREHQATSMRVLAPHLSDIGVYVIEDISRLDKDWHDYLIERTPPFLRAGFIVPEFRGTGSIADEILFVAVRRSE